MSRRAAAAVSLSTLGLASLFAASCDSASRMLERPPDFERYDSGGVTVVRNNPVDVRFLQTWSIDTTPLFTIGVTEGDSAYEFSGVRGVRQMPDGMIVVLNGAGESAYEFRFFDSTGKHMATHGRRGDGPGEYRWVNYVGSAGGDTVIAVDFGAKRLNWVSAAEGYMRSIQLDENRLKQILGRDASGLVETMVPLADSLYAIKAFRRVADAQSPLERAVSFHIVDASTGAHIDLMTHREPGVKQIQLSTGPSYVSEHVDPPLPEHVVDTERQRICGAITSVAEITCVDKDGKRTVIRWPAEVIPYTDADRKDIQDRTRANMERGGRFTPQDIELMLSAYVYPENFNPFRTFLLDAGGNFWIHENATTPRGERYTRFRILKPDGEQLGFADAFPISGISSLNRTVFIGNDMVLRRITNAEGAEQVGAFRIRKRGE